MLVDIGKIVVKDRIRKDFGDIQELAQDIKDNGLINPPVVTPEFELIAGERRLRAMEYLDYKQLEVRIMTVKDALHQLKLEISENENRKDFSFSEKMQWANQLKKEYEKIAKMNMSKGGQGSPISDTLRTDEAVANDLDMGRDTYRKAEFVSKNADEEMIKQLDEGKLSVNKAYVTLKQEKEQLQMKNKELESKLTNQKIEPKVVEVEKIPEDYLEVKQERDKLKSKNLSYEEQLKKEREEKNNFKKEVQAFKEHIKLKEGSSYSYEAKDYMDFKHACREFMRKVSHLIYMGESFENSKPEELKNFEEEIKLIELWCSDMKQALQGNTGGTNLIIIENGGN